MERQKEKKKGRKEGRRKEGSRNIGGKYGKKIESDRNKQETEKEKNLKKERR